MRRFSCCCFVFVILLVTAVPGYALKRVAVLYFEDHSGFDSGGGCGCIPLGPLGAIFGRGNQHVRWDLATGFRDLTIKMLDQSPYYDSVSFDELVVAMAEEGYTFRDLARSADKRTRLADKLNADALLVGDIRKFGQERLKGNASRNVLYYGGQTTSITGGVEAVGYYYRAHVEMDLEIYDALGKQLGLSHVEGTEIYQVGGVNASPFQAVTSNRGTEVRMGTSELTNKIERPITSYKQLDRIAFGSPEYHRTLFGLASEKAIENLVLALQERIGPAPNSIPPAELPPGITGKIAFVDGDTAYINLGSADGLQPKQRLIILAPSVILDPDTEEVLGSVNQVVGKAEIVEVKTDRFSQIKILERTAEIAKGNIVQLETEKLSPTNKE